MAVGQGHGKLILFGEHSAVYNHPAVGIQLPVVLDVIVTPITGDDWKFIGILESEHEVLERAAEALCRLLDTRFCAHRVEVRGDLPFGVGFGSSAAFCAGIIRALGLNTTYADPYRLWEAAHELERVFHGTPSGIDTGLSILPGIHAIYPDPPRVPRAESITLPETHLVVGAIDRYSSTAELVSGIKAARESDPDRVDTILSELGRIARTVIDNGRNPQLGPAWLGDLADSAHRLLADLGLTTPQLEQTLEMLREEGSTGGKLSGAGGGGAFYAVFETQAEADRAGRALRHWIADKHLLTGRKPFVEVIALTQTS